MRTLFEADGQGGAAVVLLTEPEEVGRLIGFFESTAAQLGWEPGDQLRACQGCALHLAVLAGGEIVGGLQAVVGEGDALPFRRVWPEVGTEGAEAGTGGTPAAHVTILALAREHRGRPGLFWPLCVELWRWCDRRGIGTILMEATPATLRVYRRIGWPLEVVGELRTHWGEGCLLCRVGVRQAEEALRAKAGRSTAYRRIVAMMSRPQER